MDTTTVKLPIHKHPLSRSVRFLNFECDGCHVKKINYSGYNCNEPYCYYWFHKECGEAPLEINHPSHPQHPNLLLTNEAVGDGPCDLCGQKLLAPCYSCPTCEFKVDLTCGIKPSPIAIEHPLCHDHPLVFLKKREEKEEKFPCEVCKESTGAPFYSCLECDAYFHVGCVHISKEVNFPYHAAHPLKCIASETLTDDAQETCHFCGKQPENVLYHCSICNFTVCLPCTKNPPPLVVEHNKTHEHPLRLISCKITFTCKVCGVDSHDNRPYVCLECAFFVHGSCIGTPRVININRHDHRISFTHHLGHKHIKCGVCRKDVSQYYGAYSCLVCPNYAVHTRCARRIDIWDGKELEGLVDDDNEEISPFTVVGHNLISHFSHAKHTLRLHNNNIIHDEWTRCEACIHPVGHNPIYSCEECSFVIHEKCANSPMKKRLVFGYLRYNLLDQENQEAADVIDCKLCGVLSTGFRYTSPLLSDVDVHCASLSEPFVYGGHSHPLYFDRKKGHLCDGCNDSVDDFVLRCETCDFDLCLYCASLPVNIRHTNDEHPLTLCFSKDDSSGKYWCDICERELDPSKLFYTCSSCGGTLHAQCVIGDFSRFMPQRAYYFFGEKKFDVVLNNHNTRPLCSGCHSRCKVSVILKSCYEDNTFICSRSCLSIYLGRQV